MSADSPTQYLAEDEQLSGRSSTRKALIAIAVILTMILAAVTAGAIWVNSKFGAIEKIESPFDGITNIEGAETRPTHDDEEESPNPVNFLVMGTDSRVSAGDPNQWEAGGQRTDVLMVLQISGDRSSVNLMSIPRDSWVNIPGIGNAKINAAFSHGGPTLAIATVEQLTGIPIDHIAIVDFTSFSKLTDAVGGVDITSEAGTHHYNGEQALEFVRERKGLPGGDFDRVRRQQAWMSAVMSKVMTRENLTSPSKLLEIYDAVSPHVAVDDTLSVMGLVGLAQDMTNIRSGDFNFMTAPYAGTGRSSDGQSIVILAGEEFDALTEAFAKDRVAEYLEEHPDSVQTLDDGVVH